MPKIYNIGDVVEHYDETTKRWLGPVEVVGKEKHHKYIIRTLNYISREFS